MKQIAKKIKVEQDPIYYELAEWFYASGEDVRSPDDILAKIYKIRDRRGAGGDIMQKEYAGYIKEVRAYLETKFKCTLVNVRMPGQLRGGYKIANDAEATLYGTRQYKQWILKGERVRRITPLMKREHLYNSMKKVFGDLKEETERFRRLGEIFLPAYDQEVKEIKQIEHEQKAKEITDGKQRLVNVK